MAKDFNELFDRWAENYDNTVLGSDIEYRAVFKNYETILRTIADRTHGVVIEFGIGTGNLMKLLLEKGLEVVGVEPSDNMRKIAQLKLPEAQIVKGDFLSFPKHDKRIDTIVSTYAFHHLTDVEKEQAIQDYTGILNRGGKIIFGDTIFANDQAKEDIYAQAKKMQYDCLAQDLNTEYYTTIPKLEKILKKHDFTVTFEQVNDFVWIMEAIFEPKAVKERVL